MCRKALQKPHSNQGMKLGNFEDEPIATCIYEWPKYLS